MQLAAYKKPCYKTRAHLDLNRHRNWRHINDRTVRLENPLIGLTRLYQLPGRTDHSI